MPKTIDGVAAPESADEIGHSLMAAVAGRVGIKPPAVEKKPKKPKPDADENADADADADEDADADADENADVDADADEDAEANADADKDADADADEDADADKAADADVDADADANPEAKETEQFVNAKLKDLPAPLRKRVQGVIDARIGKITAQNTEKFNELSARNDELEGELAEANKNGGAPIVVPGTHPLFLVDSADQIDAHELKLDQFEDWAAKYQDGFNLPDADDHDPKQPSWTARQIADRLRELQRERTRILPAARAHLEKRAAADAKLKQTFPALFDRKAPEYRAAQAVLKAQPELRRHPDMNGIIARQILGEKALAELAKTKTAPARKPAPGPKKAPRVPGAGGPAKGAGAARERGSSGASAAEQKLRTATSTRDIRKAVELAMGG